MTYAEEMRERSWKNTLSEFVAKNHVSLKTKEVDADAWLKEGISKGYCSPPWCESHTPPVLDELLTEEEQRDGDPCVNVLRLF